MKIVILGAGKMGSFFADVLSFDHEVALYDVDPQRLRFAFNTLRMTRPEEIGEFAPDLVINAATVKYTIEAFESVLPYLPARTILSDIASVKTGLPEFYARAGHPFVSTHPMFGPTFANLSDLSTQHVIIITEGDHLGKVFFKDIYQRLRLNIFEYSFREHDETIAYDAIKEIGAGGDFLGHVTTLMNVDMPSHTKILDRQMYGGWDRDGRRDTADIAHDVVAQALANPPLYPVSDDVLKAKAMDFDYVVTKPECFDVLLDQGEPRLPTYVEGAPAKDLALWQARGAHGVKPYI